MLCIFCAYTVHMLTIFSSIKIHVQDLFKKLDLKVNKGISSTWNNQSEQYRYAMLDRSRGKYLLFTFLTLAYSQHMQIGLTRDLRLAGLCILLYHTIPRTPINGPQHLMSICSAYSKPRLAILTHTRVLIKLLNLLLRICQA
jgi:hypothetical protein